MNRFFKFSLYSLFILVTAYLILCWNLAGILSDANNETIEYKNYFPGEIVQDWILTTKDNQKISAWFIKKDTTKAVILLAGKGGNRYSMLSRAKLYLAKNYSVVLPDLRGTGNSIAKNVTFGYKERYDLLACVDTLLKLKYDNISAHGHSLGAATIAYSFKDFSDYSFVVLESCYDNIDQAFKHRMDRIHLPELLSFPVKWLAEFRLDIDNKELYPENYMEKINCPALFLCGDKEWQLTTEESRKLVDKCASDEKYFHVFKGAQHQDFLLYNQSEYKIQLDKVLQ